MEEVPENVGHWWRMRAPEGNELCLVCQFRPPAAAEGAGPKSAELGLL
jgi:hypothetical protein